jgi:prepilin signal peptidase PulO-like enzyme (type II secretory pathway)
MSVADFIFLTLFFFCGASIGSFVQVVVTRLNVAPMVRSRSKCLSCGEALRVSDLIPVISYLTHRGKCKYCKVPFGIETMIIEIGFGLLYVALYHFILSGFGFLPGIAWFLYYSALFVSLGVIALYDLKHTYIPFVPLVSFSGLAILMAYMRYAHEPVYMFLLGPCIVALPFFAIWLISRGRALGFGDVLLFLGVGAFFGVEQGLAVLLLSIWFGALIGLVIYFNRRRKGGISTAIPFVPFILGAFIFTLFTDLDIFSIVSFFS